MTIRIDANRLLRTAERDARRIKTEKHSLDVYAYLRRRLPMEYPNKGIVPLAKAGITTEIHHEFFDLRTVLHERSIDQLETLIDYYGSTLQRDYCYMVTGHRFNQRQKIQFRGVLGLSRLYKLALALMVAGFPREEIRILDHQPNYDAIIERDLLTLNHAIDEVFIGGEGVFGLFLPKSCTVASARGDIVSYRLCKWHGKYALLTTFPYGDLCTYVVKGLVRKGVRSLSFVGSAGAINRRINFRDVVAPISIADEDGHIVTHRFHNHFAVGHPEFKATKLHGSVRTPLLETMRCLKSLAHLGCETVDVEAAHFQKGCEKWLDRNGRVGVVLYVFDKARSIRTLAQNDYFTPDVVKAREHLSQLIEAWLTRSP